MKNKLLSFLFFSGFFYNLLAQNLAIGEWRTHLAWRNVNWLTDAGDRIYCVSNASFFSYDKETGALQKFDKVSGLSDIGVKIVEYFKEKDMLLVIYDNTNIDVIKGNTIINISDIKRKSIIGEKTINHVYFFNNLAYLSCSFGILVLDLEKMEVKDTYVIGSNGDNKVYALTSDGVSFYAATEGGIKKAPVNSPNLANFEEWTTQNEVPSKPAHHAVTFNEKIYVEVADTIYEFDGNSWSYFFNDTLWHIEHINASNNHLVICQTLVANYFQGRVVLIDKSDLITNPTENYLIRMPLMALFDEEGTLWMADFLYGLLRQRGDYTDAFYPQGPSSLSVQKMAVNNSQLWLATASITAQYNRDGFFSFIDDSWSTYNQNSIAQLDTVFNFCDVVVDPTNGKVYCASFWNGVYEFDNGTVSFYNVNNSTLAPPAVDVDQRRTYASGVALDKNGNLWVSNYAASKPISVKKTDGTWKAFEPSVEVQGNWVYRIIIDDYDQKWIATTKGNSHGILVFNHGAEIDDVNDGDAYKLLANGEGRGNLPSNEVLCLANDKEGEIWIGTAEGIAVFYCAGSIFSEQGCEAQRILVTQDGVAGYLLETERVNAIAVDGANRKWIGTNSGVWLFSPDGTKQIAYFNEENSPLISNNITDIAIDHQTGEVFIATEKGLMSYMGDAIEGKENHDHVLVYPNPVRQNYEGPIAIKGLVTDADVKITDVTGTLIYQTKALGGQAVWNARNYNGARAKTGVYLIFSSNEDGSEKYVGKFLVVN